MGQYKVPQNVESEDKILGPLTIKQFIYIIIAFGWGLIIWRIFANALPVAIVLILPVSGIFLALGLVQREGQSFENYFVAMVRYFFMPRQTIWMKELETVSAVRAPKKKKDDGVTEKRSPEEIRGSLKRLASMIDTQGQFKKGAELQLADDQNQAAQISQRIAGPRNDSLEQHINNMVQANDDVLDPTSERASSVGTLLQNVEQDVRAQARATMQQSIQQPGQTPANPPPDQTSPPPTTSQTPAQNDILKMATQSGNISVSQLASQANRHLVLEEGHAVQISR